MTKRSKCGTSRVANAGLLSGKGRGPISIKGGYKSQSVGQQKKKGGGGWVIALKVWDSKKKKGRGVNNTLSVGQQEQRMQDYSQVRGVGLYKKGGGGYTAQSVGQPKKRGWGITL